MKRPVVAVLLLAALPAVLSSNVLNINKGSIVHLFEWKWNDIAQECEDFLAPKGYSAVQISPVTENLVVEGRPWWERYQVVSYQFTTRSGTHKQLYNMLKRCNKVGIKVFADVVFNHMTPSTDDCTGTGGSNCDPDAREYSVVPYFWDDFHHPACEMKDFQNATEVRVCEYVHNHDLDQSREHVRNKIVEYLNHLVQIGIAGFRVDAAKHMYPADLRAIYSRVNNLNTAHGHPPDTRPFIYQEVLDAGEEAVKYEEYTPLGLITDIRYGHVISDMFRQRTSLRQLHTFGSDYIAPDSVSVVFVDNHDTERSSGGTILNYKDAKMYKMAVAFMLAWGHGHPLILSSFKFDNFNDGPPADRKGNILSPQPNNIGGCANAKWVCQHRWRQIYSMVAFNKATAGLPITSWWDNGPGGSQIAFTRGNKGFVAFNMENKPLTMKLQTMLRPGTYCNVISGLPSNGKCEGTMVQVEEGGIAWVAINAYNENDDQTDGIFAIFDSELSRLPG